MEVYTNETRRRLNEKVIDHNKRDKEPHLYRHSQESCNPCVALSDFKIFGNTFQNQKFKGKIVVSLLIRQ